MDKRNYFVEYVFVWLKALIFFVIGGYIGALINDGVFLKDLGFFLAAAVFGMTFFNKVIPFNLFGNADSVIIFWILKFIISFIIGVIAFPIVNLYYIIKILASIISAIRNK